MYGELQVGEIDALLESSILGHLGCNDGAKPYVFPMAFVYHNDIIYGQTSTGLKLNVLRRNPYVCFQVQDSRDGWWQSVLCWGQFNELDLPALQEPEGIAIAKLLTEKIGSIQRNVGVSVPFSFAKGAAPVTVNNRESTLFRIVITEKSGRWYKADDAAQ